MSENGTELERLRVVVEADTSPYKKEMKGLAEETKKDAKELDKQNDSFKKSMNGQFGAVKKVREQMDKFYNATMKAFKLQGSGFKNNNGFQNSLKGVKGFGLKGFENPLKKVFGEEGMQQFRNPYAHIFNSQKEFQKEMDSVESRMRKLISTRDELEASGGDIEMTAEFKDLTKAAEQAEKKLNRLIEKKDRLAATGGLTTKNQRTLNYDISQAENELKFAKAAMADMSTSDKYQNTEKWNKLNREIGKCRVSLAQYHEQEQRVGRGNTTSRISKTFSSLYARLQKVTPAIKKVSGAFAALIQKFRNGIPVINRAKNSMGGFGGLGGMFKTLGMTARFMFASFLIQGVLGQAKAGMQNLAKYSNIYGTQFNSSVSMMYSALKQLQNALATAFAPIINVVAPYITTFIKYLTAGANALAQFFSALTGSKTWTRATYNTQNYADSLDNAAGSAKKLRNELYGFDEITRQSDDEGGSGGSGGGGGGVSPGNMFTEETVNNQFADFANMVKDAWKKADFTEIGEIVGNKLNDALSNIPWDKIKKTTEKIAKSVATFLNGFIKATDWNLVGSTIAEGINTAVLGVHTFLTTFDWHALGGSIATLIDGAIKTTDFSMIGATLAEGIKAAVGTWYQFVKTFDFSQLGTKISDSINSFFNTLGKKGKNGLTGWQEMGKSFSGSIAGIAKSITTALGTVNWKEIGQAIADFLGSIDWSSIIWDLGEMAMSLGEAIIDTVSGIGDVILDDARNRIAEKYGIDIGPGGRANSGGSRKILNNNDKENIGGAISGIGNILNTNGSRNNKNGAGILTCTVAVDESTSKRNVITATNNLNRYTEKNPLKTKIKSTTSGKEINATTQKEFGLSPLVTGIVASNTGADVRRIAQGEFEKNPFSTKMKSSNTGRDVWSIAQKLFSKELFSTKMKSSNTGRDVWSIAQNEFARSPLSTVMATLNNGFDLKNIVQAQFGASTLFTGVSSTSGAELFSRTENDWNNSRRNLNVTVNAALGAVTGGLAALLSLRAEGGVFANGRWQPVTAYANGGLPNTGQLFVAREAGPELVGTIGGNTAVMNNKQIVSSVAAGVSGAVYSAVLAAMAKSGGGSPSFNIYVGGKRITDVVIEEVNQRTKATGVSPLLV